MRILATACGTLSMMYFDVYIQDLLKVRPHMNFDLQPCWSCAFTNEQLHYLGIDYSVVNFKNERKQDKRICTCMQRRSKQIPKMSNGIRTVDLLAKKRAGESLSDEEIRHFVQGVVSGEVQDVQLGKHLFYLNLSQLSGKMQALYEGKETYMRKYIPF